MRDLVDAGDPPSALTADRLSAAAEAAIGRPVAIDEDVLRAALDPAACAAARLQTGSSSPAAMHAMLAGLEATLAADLAWSVGAREQRREGRGRAPGARTRARRGVTAPRFQRAPRVAIEAPSAEGLIVPARGSAVAVDGDAGTRRLRRGLPGRRARSSWARSARCRSTRRRQPRPIPSSVCAISRSSSTVTPGRPRASRTQLVDYERTTRFCGVCGTAREWGGSDLGRTCPNCGDVAYPRISPCAIVLVHDGGRRVLLGKRANWPVNRYSLLAGFVEPGESLEQCAAPRGARGGRGRDRPTALRQVAVLAVPVTADDRVHGPLPVGRDRRRPRGDRGRALVRPRRPARAATPALDRPPDPRAALRAARSAQPPRRQSRGSSTRGVVAHTSRRAALEIGSGRRSRSSAASARRTAPRTSTPPIVRSGSGGR